MSSQPLLSLENLSAHYVSQQGTRVVRAVDDVTLSVAAGGTLGIVGESGSGKSTLALAILRLLERASRANAWERAVALLKSVRIASPETRVSQFPHEMSGGMRQRIVGAIGISCEPRLLIADEPTTSLDLTIQAQYLNLLRELQREHGLALIFITHNLGIVAKMCDQLAVMYAGRVVEQGPVSQIFSTPMHPYTKALLGSIPRMTDNREHLTAIEGQPPDLASLPAGCSFAARCPAAFGRCRVEAPPEFALGEGRTARCWLAAPGAEAKTAMQGSSVA